MELLELDGAHGEGGGQVVRSALGLAVATGRGFRITNVRGRRAKPGLLRQHLTAARAVADVCGGRLRGAELRSRELTFVPGAPRPGRYRFDIGSAGSTLLVVQAMLPVLATTPGRWQLALTGGTHNPMAPSYEFFARALAPLLGRMGVTVRPELERAGFYPAGGGRLHLAVDGVARPARLDLPARGAVRSATGFALVANLPGGVGHREVATLCARLGWPSTAAQVLRTDASGPGNAVVVAVEAEHVTEVITSLGAKGVPAEAVATAAADEVAAYLAADVPVGAHLADQLLVPMALGDGGTFDTTAPTLHTTTQVDLVRWFLGSEITLAEVAPGRWRVTVPPRP